MHSQNLLQKIMLLTMFFLMGVAVRSQNPNGLSAGAREVGMAYTTTATTGFWTSFHNQASLAYMSNLSIGINQDNRFGLSELSNKTFGFIIPTGHGSLGAVYSYYGYEDYNRHSAGLAYGLKIGRMLSLGVQADLYSTRAALDYESTNELSCEIGALLKPVKGLTIGLHTFNPLPNSIRDRDMPTVISLGLGYLFSETFYTGIELEASNSGRNRVRLGLEYQVYDNFYIRGGLMTEPRGISFGFGYSGSFFQGNLGFITHEDLGLTPSLSIVLFIN